MRSNASDESVAMLQDAIDLVSDRGPANALTILTNATVALAEQVGALPWLAECVRRARTGEGEILPVGRAP